jgi:hypothetical protein
METKHTEGVFQFGPDLSFFVSWVNESVMSKPQLCIDLDECYGSLVAAIFDRQFNHQPLYFIANLEDVLLDGVGNEQEAHLVVDDLRRVIEEIEQKIKARWWFRGCPG